MTKQIIVHNIELTRNHLSTHFAWNSCEHGNTRSVCLGSKSQMQMTHDVWSPGQNLLPKGLALKHMMNERTGVTLTRVRFGVELVVGQLFDLEATEAARFSLTESLC
jgi:hypothetical protein